MIFILMNENVIFYETALTMACIRLVQGMERNDPIMDDIHPDEKKSHVFKTSLTMRAHVEREREHEKRGDPKWMIFIQVNNNVVPQTSLTMRAIGGEQ
jgi:hypothetical protein